MSRTVSVEAAAAAKSDAVGRHRLRHSVSLVVSILLVALQYAYPTMATGQAYLVKDTWPGSPSSNLSGFVEANGNLFFAAHDGVHGVELWKSDGTEEGTVLVKDIGLGFGSEPGSLTNLDGTLFFAATDATAGRELWKSDGTAAGTLLVKDIPPTGFSSGPTDLTPFNHQLFFSAAGELWKSDGTTAGTIRVRDFPGSGGLGPSHLTSASGILFFAAFDPATGFELWKSDGTTAGTVLVKDIKPGIDTSNPVSLVNVNGTLFFLAFDGTHGVELWTSDGTAAGTVLVKDIYPGSQSGFPSFSAYLTNVEGTLFFAADDGVHGVELWKSDGTDTGTVLVKDIFPGGPFSWSNPSYLTVLNDAVYFAALEFTFPFSLNVELWRSDGTESGTFRVKDITPGPLPSSPTGMVEVNGMLFFSASDAVHGPELWKSDGTEAGTELVDDIVPGPAGSQPRLITLAGSHVFFAANDFVVGEELWATAAPPAPPPSCSTDGDCSDGNACTVNRCLNGACDFSQPLQCDDGNACNGVETCDPVSGCRAGAPPQEICTGGLDEDCDGAVDCNDADCAFASACLPLQPPTDLRATVGESAVYLSWDPPPHSVDGYDVQIEEELGGTFGEPSIHSRGPIPCAEVDGLVDGRLYRVTVVGRTPAGPTPPSNAILAVPGGFAFTAPRPPRPLLLLHGFLGSGRVAGFVGSNLGTWTSTVHFFQKALGWTYGGRLYHVADSLDTRVDRDGDGTAGSTPDDSIDPSGDFFTVDFGAQNPLGVNVADYGLAHQGTEVESFAEFLTENRSALKISLLAHSNGGLAARYALARPMRPDFPGSVDRLITYGTPHRGADVDSVRAGVDAIIQVLGAVAHLAGLSGIVDVARELVSGVVSDLVDLLADSPAAVDAAFLGCSDQGEPLFNPFLSDLSDRPLPGGIAYTSVVGHWHPGPLTAELREGLLQLRRTGLVEPGYLGFIPDCLFSHWDGLVPVASANLRAAQVTPTPARVIVTDHFHIGQGNDFPTWLCVLDERCVIFRARSPIEMEVIAPDGRSMSRSLARIPGASHMDVRDEEDHLVETIVIPFPLGGDYRIRVSPKPGASPSDTYMIEVEVGGANVVLARDVPVAAIPFEGYGIEIAGSEVVPFVPLVVDVKPGDAANVINMNSGVVPVGVLSTAPFDATLIDPISVAFGPSKAHEAHGRGHLEDINGDGRDDLVLHFRRKSTGLTQGDTRATLEGRTYDGRLVRGSDSVRVIP